MLFLEYPPCSTCQKAKKWLDGMIQPGKAVPHFVDAEGDHIALAASAAPLVHDQGAAAQSAATLDAAAHIPLRDAPIAMEQELRGGAGGEFIVSAPEL